MAVSVLAKADLELILWPGVTSDLWWGSWLCLPRVGTAWCTHVHTQPALLFFPMHYAYACLLVCTYMWSAEGNRYLPQSLSTLFCCGSGFFVGRGGAFFQMSPTGCLRSYYIDRASLRLLQMGFPASRLKHVPLLAVHRTWSSLGQLVGCSAVPTLPLPLPQH